MVKIACMCVSVWCECVQEHDEWRGMVNPVAEDLSEHPKGIEKVRQDGHKQRREDIRPNLY